MSILPFLSRRRSDQLGLGFTLAFAGSLFWMCGTVAAGASGGDTALASVAVVPAVAAPVTRADDPVEIERQQRLRELRRHLLEHSQSWRSDAALRRSAAMPEPTDPPAVVADKILPLAPQSGAQLIPAAAGPVQVLPLAPNAAPGRLLTLPNAVPDAMAAPVAPVLPAPIAQDAAAVQAAPGIIDADRVADTLSPSDPRLTERERRQLRQQLRQVLRLQEPVGNR